MLKMAKLEFENHKINISLGCFDPNKYFWKSHDKIGLSLFDLKQLLIDSGNIVQWSKFSTESYSRPSPLEEAHLNF